MLIESFFIYWEKHGIYLCITSGLLANPEVLTAETPGKHFTHLFVVTKKWAKASTTGDSPAATNARLDTSFENTN